MGRGSAGGPRILLYSQDGLGLGHQRRTSSIAAALSSAVEDADILSVVDSPLGPFFRLAPGHDCVKLPSIIKVSPGVWRPVGLSGSFAHVSAVRRALLDATVESFRPDLMLVDHMPHGALGELLPTLHGLVRRRRRPRIVLGLRDIIDAPEVVRRVWVDEGAYDALDRCYDSVLVYGERDIFDPVEHYAFPASVAAKVRYTGYLCTPERSRYAATVRRRAVGPASGDRALLVATAGGGADAYPEMSAVLDAIPLLRRVRPWAAVVVTGPFMPAQQRRDLERRGRALDVRVRVSVSDPLSYVDAADVVVARAGYSSTVEIVRSGTPAVLLPRPGPSAEQRMRSERFSSLGWVGWVDPAHLSGEAVAAAVLQRLSDANHVEAPPPRGLETTVDHLLELVDGRGAEVPFQRARTSNVPTA